MRPTAPLLAVSLAANLAFGAWWLLRDVRPASEPPPAVSPSLTRPAAATPPAATAAAPSSGRATPADDPAALRDRLRALGFSEPLVRAAVRARLEAPRLARERAWRTAAAAQPWWRPGAANLTSEQSRELRQAERTEIERVLGAAGTVTPAEIERYAYFPEDKAARLAVIQRDYAELRRALQSQGGTNAELRERRNLLDAECERDLAALLTPEEREQLELRSSNAAHVVSRSARYFSGTEADYLALYGLMKKEQAEIDASPESRPGSIASRFEQREADLKAVLGDRYAAWKVAGRADSSALIELQRRFAVPAATTDAVAAAVRAVGVEGLAVAQNKTLTVEQKKLALLDLATSARQRVIAILGDDLGSAYNTASSSAWLDQLERGQVPYYLPSGQRALHLIGGDLSRTRTVAPKK